MSKHFLAALILISACISGPARAEDAAAFRAWRTREFPKMFPGGSPPNTLLIITRLADPDYLLEVQTVAAL